MSTLGKDTAQPGMAARTPGQQQSSLCVVGVIRVPAAQAAQGDCVGGDDVAAGP